MPLHIKYRPQCFEEVVGNEETVAAIQAILGRSREDIPHAFLMVGPSGCGKTTLARLIAAQMECEDSDLHEMDSAHFRGIDTIREVREVMAYLPTGRGKSRVWILDECHQLSKDAQHALLKALEDTPKHVYFMLATTDPGKLLPTIRNRCTTLEVKALKDKELRRLLKWVCREEKIELPEEVAEQIMSDSLGSARAALVVLDKVRDMPVEKMMEAARVVAAQENSVIDLCRTMLKTPTWQQVAPLLPDLANNAEGARMVVLKYFNKVLLGGGRRDGASIYLVLKCFSRPFYETGEEAAALSIACFEACEALTGSR